MNHDPFLSLNSEQTLIKPNLGRGNLAPKPNDASQTKNAQGLSEIQKLFAQKNRLVAQADLSMATGPFLRAGSTLQRISLEKIQLKALNTLLTQALDQLEIDLAGTGRNSEQRLAIRYLLCTYLDEMAANTSWGTQGSWAEHSLLLHYFKETWGGEKVYALLNRFQEQPEKYHDLLKLFHLILSLGFKGRYHVMQSGAQLHEKLRAELASTLERTEPAPAIIAPRWQTDITPRNRVLQQIPIWLTPALCFAIGLGLFTSMYFHLNSRSDDLFQQISMLQVKAPELERPEPTAAQKSLGEFLNERLAPEVAKGNLSIDYKNGHWVITLMGDGLFGSGSDQINTLYEPTLEAVSLALEATSGDIRVMGHTDSTPIRSLQYPSNWHLSGARANQVSSYLSRNIESNRLNAQGAGASEPISSNKTAQGRAMNRRVELWLSDPTQSTYL
jgi:type VI secretion system protein ImpK